MKLINNNFSKHNLLNQSHKNITLLSSNLGGSITTRFQTNQPYHFQASRGMNKLSASTKGILKITFPRLPLNAIKQKNKTLGYQKKIPLKVEIVDKIDKESDQEDSITTYVNLDWAHNEIVSSGFKFNFVTARAWLMEYIKYSRHQQEGQKIALFQGKMKPMDEVLNSVWDPRAAGKGLHPDVSVVQHDFHISPDQQTVTLLTKQQDSEMKARSSDFKNSSQEAGANKSFKQADSSLWVNQQPEKKNEVIKTYNNSGDEFLESHVTEAEVLAPQTTILSKTEIKGTEKYTHDVLLDTSSESAEALDTAALLITNVDD